MTGRKKSKYTSLIRITTTQETSRALDLLAESTGLSVAHLGRLALARYLTELGLLDPVDLSPTLTAGPNTRRRKE